MVVNLASKWGLTDDSYTQMVEFHEKYASQGFEILGFPCNQFGKQECGTNESIKMFIREEYDAKFPLFAKAEINGKDCCEVYKFLRVNSKEHYDEVKQEVKEIPWNFAKFLVNSKGQVVSFHGPLDKVKDLVPNIEALLNEWYDLILKGKTENDRKWVT